MQVAGRTYLLKPWHFRQWLTARPASDVVGWRNHTGRCPIANYLIDYGFRNVAVRRGTMFASRRSEPNLNRPTPFWAREFIYRVDSAVVVVGTDHDMRLVQAHQALAALDLALETADA